jgi:hypothetical protein
VKALPSVQGLWEKYKDQGLHIFLVESQGGTKDSLEQYAKDKGLTFPIAIRNDCDFNQYKGGNGLPYAFVVGPDGKVAWQGRKGYAAVIAEQLERIKYPGLGKFEVNEECDKAATLFSEKEYGKAREEAMDVKEDEADNPEAVADAEFIIKRVDEKVASLNAAVDDAISKKRYLDAVRLLEELEGKAFKGMDEVQEAAEKRREELEDDDEIKDEIKAWEKLEKTLESNEKARSDEQRRSNLIKFWEKYEGTAAAEEARRLADALEG